MTIEIAPKGAARAAGSTRASQILTASDCSEKATAYLLSFVETRWIDIAEPSTGDGVVRVIPNGCTDADRLHGIVDTATKLDEQSTATR